MTASLLPDPFGAPFVLLEDRLSPAGEARLFTAPERIITARTPAEAEGALAALEAAQRDGLHLAGFLAYEFGHSLEPRLAGLRPDGEGGGPLLWFGAFPAPRRLARAAVDAAFAARPAPQPLTQVAPGLTEAAHAAALARVRGYLEAGDAYQVNLTFPIRFRFGGDPLALYAALRAAQPAAHGGIVATGTEILLSVSPELFLEVDGDRAVTRPMKGTAGRGATPAEDAAAAAALRADPKQRAENLMIVDLLRNDLSRVSRVGSVRVPDLFTVETYPTLHTLTSTVTSRLSDGIGAPDILRAMFPCGSVTGAPKIRAMEIIHELEAGPRGGYTGSIGRIDPNGDLAFNVAIRTAVLDAEGRGIYGAGGGIVIDSDPATEYREALLKARVLTDLAADFGLIETFRWTRGGGVLRLDAHLARLSRSAAELGFAFDEEAARARIAAESFEGPDRRVRLQLARDGHLALTSALLEPVEDRPLRVGLAAARTDAGNPFVRHKTTRRVLWETAFAEAEAAGLDEAILLNREGFVTESARATVFLKRDGVFLTPPLAHGLLPGVLRAALLANGSAREAPLRPEDLSAGLLLLGNSLRGLRAARFLGGATES